MKWDETGALLRENSLMDWEMVYQLCMDRWQEEPSPATAADLIFACWYPTTEPRLIAQMMPLQNELLDTLKATAQNAISEYRDDPYFAMVAGYCIAFSPDAFGEADEWRAIGKSLLESAHKQQPDDPIVSYLYQTWVDRSTAHSHDLDAAAAKAAQKTFSGGDLVSAYFRQVIGGV